MNHQVFKKTYYQNSKFADMPFLPICKEDLEERGWDEVDIIVISADAYVDHPSFGHAVVSRLFEHEGLRVAVLPQPNWRDDLRDFKKLGRPRMFFAISSGMDSMVNHYTANKRLRSDDAFTAGGKAGFRPDYATYVYCQALKLLYPDVPVLIGGLESSLRRITHYDYWSDKLKPGILADTQADLLVYGMGEKPLKEIIRLLKKGVPFSNLNSVPQTAYLAPKGKVPKNKAWEDLVLASHEDCVADKTTYFNSFKKFELETNKMFQHRVLQDCGEQTIVVNPPYPPMEYGELDESFEYPYMREPHPRYKKRGPVPAFEMIKFSINTHRGCFGGCSFCAINAHQGKFIANRSRESILREVEIVTNMPGFAGTITDLGGPSANMYKMGGKDKTRCAKCARPTCLQPTVCDNLDTSLKELTELYREVRNHPKVKHVFIGSGIRYDILLHNPTEEIKKEHEEYTRELIAHHVSGRLKVAPEHTSDVVLKLMRKPSFSLFYKFKEIFDRECARIGKKQQIIPYFISSHPGCTEADMAELALETKQLGFKLEQVQDFTPTPLTMATEMYYAELGPDSKPIYVAKKPEQKKSQQRFFFWYMNENRLWIQDTLERLKMGKIARLLLSRKPIEGEREYRPSEDSNKNYDPRARSGLKVRNTANHQERIANRMEQNEETVPEQKNRMNPENRRYNDKRRDDRRFEDRRRPSGRDYMDRKQAKGNFRNNRPESRQEESSAPQFESRRRRR